MGRQVLFGIPGYMKWIPCPLTGMESTHAGSRSTTKLLNGRTFAGGSRATSMTYNVSWLGTPDELQEIINYASGVYGSGPFYYTDPLATDNALSSVYAAPHLLAEIEHLKITGTEIGIIDTPSNTYGLPPFGAVVTREVAADYTKPSKMTVAIPEGFKAVVHVYAQSSGVVRVATGVGKVFSLAGTQPGGIGTNLYQAVYSDVDFVSLHFGMVTDSPLYGLVLRLVPEAETVYETDWCGGLGHTGLVFGSEGLTRSVYMARSANGRGQIGLSGTLEEV